LVQTHEKREKKIPFTSEWLLNISNIILSVHEVFPVFPSFRFRQLVVQVLMRS